MGKPVTFEHHRVASLITQLKERKVLRVAVAYIVVAWIVMQVGEVTFEALKLPEWSQSLLVTFALLGFPIALVMAWAYEITPDGVVEDTDTHPHRRDVRDRQRSKSMGVSDESLPASIAVLPFEDMSFDQDQTYFCEGIAEEILCALAEVKGLHVAARVASFQFGSKSADILEIARKLNVSVVLEGSVRKAGEQIRITVQLIDAHDGYQFWAGQYNHDLKDIFDTQEQIALAVVSAMRLSIGDDNLLTQPMTQSTEAYDLYLKGNSYFIRPDKQNIIFARQFFERAVEVDPEYGRAWAKLASTYAYEYLCTEPSGNAKEEARRISEKALRMAPGIPESHISRGIAYSIFRDYGPADREFEVAISLDPRSFSAWFTWARSKTYEGDTSKAVEYYRKASEIRPDDYQSVLLQVGLLTTLDDSRGAIKSAKQGLCRAKAFLELNPEESRAWNMGAFALLRLGKRSEAEEWMNTSLKNSPRNSNLNYNAASFYSLAGDPDKSLDYLAQAAESGCLNLTWLEQDSDLDAVRDNPGFKEIITRFKGNVVSLPTARLM